jgi:hypothetical protein
MNNQELALIEDKVERSGMPALTIAEAKQRWDTIREFVSQIMIEGEDFGVIPGTRTKPTLLKPGAEKLCAFFGLAPDIDVSQRIEQWEAPEFFAYEVKCSLRGADGRLRGSGIGSCSSRESQYNKRRNLADVANTILKMAKKRAMVDAVLSTTGASQFYSQDVEDSHPVPKPPQPASVPLTELQKLQATMVDKDSVGRVLQGLVNQLGARDGQDKAYEHFSKILDGYGVPEWQNLKNLGEARAVCRELYDLLHQEPLPFVEAEIELPF